MRALRFTALALLLAACGGSDDAPGPDGVDEVRIVVCGGPAECDDGDGCTTDNCVGGRCMNAPRSCDDDNPCTADRCEAGQCVNEAAEECCTGPADCDDMNICTKDECIDGACTHGDPLPECCNEDADCDDGNDCTRDTCNLGTRRCEYPNNPAAGCCTTWDQCLDQEACTEDECVDDHCRHILICCRYDEDCVHEDPCMTGVCDFDTCLYTAVPGCCAGDADCPDVPCTTATCTGNECVRTPIANCCTGDPDCGDPCRECAIPAGADRGTCALKGTPECCTSTVLDVAFSDLAGFVVAPLSATGYAATPAWNLDTLRVTSAPTALYFGDPATHRLHPSGDGLVGGRATRAGVDLGSTTKPVLSFQAFRSGSIVSSVDVLSVIVVDGGTEARVWSTMDHPVAAGAFQPVTVDLSAFEGREVSLVLEFDSRSAFATDYEGVWVDDLKVAGQCR